MKTRDSRLETRDLLADGGLPMPDGRLSMPDARLSMPDARRPGVWFQGLPPARAQPECWGEYGVAGRGV